MEDSSRNKSIEISRAVAGTEFDVESEAGREVEPSAETIEQSNNTSANHQVSGGSETVSTNNLSPVPSAVRTRDPLLIEVERRLEENLWEVYAAMPQSLRLQFKQEGERLARTIRNGLATGKLAAYNVLTLIVKWLKMIPGVNQWFLIQEAKIKTDSLVRLEREIKKS